MGLWLIAQGVSSQDNSGAHVAPDELRRPERGEAPRYPKDLVIGELGQAEASEGAYLFAQNVMSAITADRREAAILAGPGYTPSESLFDEIRSIRPRYYRLGGGRTEIDGCVSFLVRIIGPEESITGELFVRRPEEDETEASGNWILDDLMLEDKRTLADIRDAYRYDFSPYERFY